MLGSGKKAETSKTINHGIHGIHGRKAVKSCEKRFRLDTACTSNWGFDQFDVVDENDYYRVIIVIMINLIGS